MSHESSESAGLAGSAAGITAVRERLDDFFELTKPRLSFLSVLTAVVGYLAADPARDFMLLLSLLSGTSLAAGGAAALNQWLERDIDGNMVRTKGRPLPAGRIEATHALLYGFVLSAAGCGILYLGTNALAGSLAAATVASYVLLYTPLKRLTTWNTAIGAIPGALPPLIGWSAADGNIAPLGWILFAILFFWQMPHFYAIAWTHRRDYAKAGFVMVSARDATGRTVAFQAFLFTAALVFASLLPYLLGHASVFYGLLAFGAGLYLLRHAGNFLSAKDRDIPARKLFLASIFYLPALLVPLVLDLWLVGG